MNPGQRKPNARDISTTPLTSDLNHASKPRLHERAKEEFLHQPNFDHQQAKQREDQATTASSEFPCESGLRRCREKIERQATPRQPRNHCKCSDKAHAVLLLNSEIAKPISKRESEIPTDQDKHDQLLAT